MRTCCLGMVWASAGSVVVVVGYAWLLPPGSDTWRMVNLAALILLALLPVLARWSAWFKVVADRLFPLSPVALAIPVMTNVAMMKIGTVLFEPPDHVGRGMTEIFAGLALVCVAAHFASEAHTQATRAQLVRAQTGC